MITTLWKAACLLAVLACLTVSPAAAQGPVVTYYPTAPYYVGPYYAGPYNTVAVYRTFPPGYGAAYDRGPVGYGPEDFTGGHGWKYNYSTGRWFYDYSR